MDLCILRDLALVRTRKSWTYVSATVGSPKSLPKVHNAAPRHPWGELGSPMKGFLGHLETVLRPKITPRRPS